MVGQRVGGKEITRALRNWRPGVFDRQVALAGAGLDDPAGVEREGESRAPECGRVESGGRDGSDFGLLAQQSAAALDVEGAPGVLKGQGRVYRAEIPEWHEGLGFELHVVVHERQREYGAIDEFGLELGELSPLGPFVRDLMGAQAAIRVIDRLACVQLGEVWRRKMERGAEALVEALAGWVGGEGVQPARVGLIEQQAVSGPGGVGEGTDKARNLDKGGEDAEGVAGSLFGREQAEPDAGVLGDAFIGFKCGFVRGSGGGESAWAAAEAKGILLGWAGG